MKPSTGTRKIQATKKVAKTAALKKPRKYKNVGGVGSSRSSGSSPRSPRSPRSGSSPRSPNTSFSAADEKELISISFDIAKLVHIYYALSNVSVKDYSFSELEVNKRDKKKDFLVFTRVNTELIKMKIEEIFVKVNSSKFISIDTRTYKDFRTIYDGRIDYIIKKIIKMTTIKFIGEAVGFFNDLRMLLLMFFDYIKENIKINDDIDDEDIIDIVNNEILRCAKGGYDWFSNTKNITNSTNNIKLFISLIGELINKHEQDRMHKKFREDERRREDIAAFHACRANKSCR